MHLETHELERRPAREAARSAPSFAVIAALLAVCSNSSWCSAAALEEGAYSWSADVLNSDFRSDTLELAGNVRVSQGAQTVEAQSATARDFRSENSEWTFRDGVQVRTAEATLRANLARARFEQGAMTSARVEGTPAQFEQRASKNNEQVRGRATTIEYDLAADVVRLTGEVWFSNGKDEFRGDVVVYHLREERVQINPGGGAPGRVQGVIRPRAANDAQPAEGDAR